MLMGGVALLVDGLFITCARRKEAVIGRVMTFFGVVLSPSYSDIYPDMVALLAFMLKPFHRSPSSLCF